MRKSQLPSIHRSLSLPKHRYVYSRKLYLTKLNYIDSILLKFMYQTTNIRSTKSHVFILKRTDTKTTGKNYEWRGFRVFASFLWINLPFLPDKLNSFLILKNV